MRFVLLQPPEEEDGRKRAITASALMTHARKRSLLWEEGYEVENNGASPLFLAAQDGHHELVRALLKVGTDDLEQAIHTTGATPLLISAQNGSLSFCLVFVCVHPSL